MSLKSFKDQLQSIKNLDQSSLDYYESEYNKLKDLHHVTIQVTDHSGNATKFHSLNVESLIFLVDLVNRMKGEK